MKFASTSISIKRIIPILTVGIMGLTLLSACKGRTTKDVEPTGDTIEVVICSTVQTDSTNNNLTTDSINNEN
ncbi:MAG: hypothetical protein K2K58_04445 [Muribaculaceae bacterium]|nr:hypothetical protein [Muribaculaceae bacterium]